MDIQGWNDRYSAESEVGLAPPEPPTRLVAETARKLNGGRALDLACGLGRNALWLASRGWTVTAIDGSATAIQILQQRAAALGLEIETQVADLERDINLGKDWDLITICYYLQPNLIALAKQALKPGGVLIVIVHITEGIEEPTRSRLRPNELAAGFEDWKILHRYEGKPDDPEHKRAVSEIVAERPTAGQVKSD